MKNIFTLLLVLLFASCGKQDVYEFERKGSGNFGFGTLKVRFQIIGEDELTLYDFEIVNEKKENLKLEQVRDVKFYDDKNFLLFQTDYLLRFPDRGNFEYDGKTKVVTRSLLEKVARLNFIVRSNN